MLIRHVFKFQEVSSDFHQHVGNYLSDLNEILNETTKILPLEVELTILESPKVLIIMSDLMFKLPSCGKQLFHKNINGYYFEICSGISRCKMSSKNMYNFDLFWFPVHKRFSDV